jgi:hypothetical protein
MDAKMLFLAKDAKRKRSKGQKLRFLGVEDVLIVGVGYIY